MKRFLTSGCGICAGILVLWTVPCWWCARNADIWWERGNKRQIDLANAVVLEVSKPLDRSDYKTGSSQFDGEWLFGTYLMAGFGLCQMAEVFPERREEWKPVIERCIEQILSAKVSAFDAESWGEDPLESLAGDNGHGAYLGYLNLLLARYAEVFPASGRFDKWNEAFSGALSRRLKQAPNHLVATYPGEWYPVDNAALASSLILTARNRKDAALGQQMEAWKREYENAYLDKRTGLLIQAIDARGRACDAPRGSGTALSAYFFAQSDWALAEKLAQTVEKELRTSFVGFGAIREYPRGWKGRGDIDSGPVIFGMGFSATGFSLAGGKILNDRDFFRKLYASAVLVGMPLRENGRERFVTAGPLGDAILLAMCSLEKRP